MEKRLYRNEHDKILSGVSSGLAEYLGYDNERQRQARVVGNDSSLKIFGELFGYIYIGSAAIDRKSVV